MTKLHALLDDLPVPDLESAVAVADRAEHILRPSGALAVLDGLAAWLAGWQRTVTPRIERPAVLVFCADHGVALAEQVSAYPVEVTAAALAAHREGRATISVFARRLGADISMIDVGVGRPTGDIRTTDALEPGRFDEIVETATDAVDELDADVLVLGEIGIGNTTAAAAVAAAVTDRRPDEWVGRGSGVDDEGLDRKRAAVEAAMVRLDGADDPIEMLRKVGGSELVAIAAASMAARHRSIPVVLDGFVVGASVLPIHVLEPSALDHCVAGHCSAEVGHRRLLELIGKEPLLDLGMRLGEGSGALAAVPLLGLACVGVTDVPTFSEWFG
ncbi:MAG: nicotinate-nucleotide--dimethylbenzimidazole phosphoribosyltransferase [Actinomycetota bacterium]|nr:nicotinate-nucleotide--dimethylbenzimidazole phosphoribosyltransferase [Actinomycetota bacterium]